MVGPFPLLPEWGDLSPSLLKVGEAKGPTKSLLTNPSSVVWQPPPSCSLKWNVDASTSFILSRSAVGGVLRNHVGVFMCLFSCSIPHMEINSAEVWVYIVQSVLFYVKKSFVVTPLLLNQILSTRFHGVMRTKVGHGT